MAPRPGNRLDNHQQHGTNGDFDPPLADSPEDDGLKTDVDEAATESDEGSTSSPSDTGEEVAQPVDDSGQHLEDAVKDGLVGGINDQLVDSSATPRADEQAPELNREADEDEKDETDGLLDGDGRDQRSGTESESDSDDEEDEDDEDEEEEEP